MAVEIERKFLVRSEAWRSLATTEASIRQAYLASGERSTTRVRIKNSSDATVTIKSKRAELRRLEIEYPISVLDAEALLSLRHSGLIEKTRFIVPWRAHRWEVDVFSGDNLGLVIAEIELRHEDETFDRPPWLGIEITGQSQYYNGSLARHHSANGQVSDLQRPLADRVRKGDMRGNLAPGARQLLRRLTTTISWSRHLFQPSWKPISSCLVRPASSLWSTTTE